MKNSNDTYIMASEAFGTKPLNIFDNLNSEFLLLDFADGSKYYMYSDSFDLETYEITINGEVYTYDDFRYQKNVVLGMEG
jgi:hypothetical protein